MRTQLLRAIMLTAGAVVGLAGWVVLGRQAAHKLPNSDRSSLAFADIDCASPLPLTRGEFLGEVQYLSNLPDRLSLSDDDLASRIAAAFAMHPMVESVKSVEVLARHGRVALRFRTPVLAVPYQESLRVVDCTGVLLPISASAAGLPRLSGSAIPPPGGAAGTLWGDSRVASAARIAAYLHSHRDRLSIETISVEDGEMILFAGDKSFRWGSPPGEEANGEPEAATKLVRLRDIASRQAGRGNRQFDLTIPQKGKDP
jgi:hypothetical protein